MLSDETYCLVNVENYKFKQVSDCNTTVKRGSPAIPVCKKLKDTVLAYANVTPIL